MFTILCQITVRLFTCFLPDHHVSFYPQFYSQLNLSCLYFHPTLATALKRQYNRQYEYDPRNVDLNSGVPGYNEYENNAQGNDRNTYYNPLYRPNDERYRVKTNYGQLSGYQVFLYDGPKVPLEDRPEKQIFHKIYKNVTVFKGIPYAEPPINDYRFEYPRPYLKNWGSIDARYYGPACPQANEYIGASKGNLHVNEDCLYLNVFTPSAYKGLRSLYPVMIYIHGGFFNYGSANRFPAHMLSASMEVVVVTFNYRLGVLGFLSTGDEASPGNYGMLDQAMAIKWVYNNIHIFNGDKDRVTLYGPGAGAASAGLHALSPRSRDYFQRIIAQSGSMLAEWAVTLDPEFSRNTTKLYGEKVGCSSSSSFGIVTCLKNRKPAELANAIFQIYFCTLILGDERVQKPSFRNLNGNPVILIRILSGPMVGWLPWTPVVDWYTQNEEQHRFLKDFPEKLLQDNILNKNLDYMCGLTADEASTFVGKYNGYEIDKVRFDKRIRKFVQMYNYTLNPDGVFNAIQFMYTPWSDENNKTLIRDGYIQVTMILNFTAMKLNKVLLENQKNPYMYVLNTTLESVKKPEWQGENPNRPTNSFNIRWDPMSLGNMQYLSLNTTNDTYSVMERDYKERESAFWTEYIPQSKPTLGDLINCRPPANSVLCR
ncbi:Neuroligin-4, X-linked [Nymphon striatum]|nr:Neuroligin-4, X-linked [Nymphon striatum]